MSQSALGGRARQLDGQQCIDLMVEQAAAGEAPSSPQPPEAGARRARLYGVSPGAENRNRQTMPSNFPGLERPIVCGLQRSLYPETRAVRSPVREGLKVART